MSEIKTETPVNQKELFKYNLENGISNSQQDPESIETSEDAGNVVKTDLEKEPYKIYGDQKETNFNLKKWKNWFV